MWIIALAPGVATLKEMIDLAASIRDQVNEHVFVFAWSAALVQRPDARLLRAPPIWEVFPDKFIGMTRHFKILPSFFRFFFDHDYITLLSSRARRVYRAGPSARPSAGSNQRRIAEFFKRTHRHQPKVDPYSVISFHRKLMPI